MRNLLLRHGFLHVVEQEMRNGEVVVRIRSERVFRPEAHFAGFDCAFKKDFGMRGILECV